MKTAYYFIISISLSSFLISCNAQSRETGNLQANVTDDSMLNKPDSFWKRVLGSDEYHILREKGTEAPFTGKWLMHDEKGTYVCNGCGHKLFSSSMKFDSDCGWPSFDSELAGNRITKKEDVSHGMVRTEIMCSNCGGHLGHLFDDGPTETGMRYCVNSLSIDFRPDDDVLMQQDTVVLGGGCFWCIEAVYLEMKGILSVAPGYAGGTLPSPSYDDVCTGETGHAEVVQLVFDPQITSLEDILRVFFEIHDPTTTDRQGADLGSQYRSVVFFRNNTQMAVIQNMIRELDNSKKYDSEIVTQVVPSSPFYEAEEYHFRYFEKNPEYAYCKRVIQPKIDKFRKKFPGFESVR